MDKAHVLLLAHDVQVMADEDLHELIPVHLKSSELDDIPRLDLGRDHLTRLTHLGALALCVLPVALDALAWADRHYRTAQWSALVSSDRDDRGGGPGQRLDDDLVTQGAQDGAGGQALGFAGEAGAG